MCETKKTIIFLAPVMTEIEMVSLVVKRHFDFIELVHPKNVWNKKQSSF